MINYNLIVNTSSFSYDQNRFYFQVYQPHIHYLHSLNQLVYLHLPFLVYPLVLLYLFL